MGSQSQAASLDSASTASASCLFRAPSLLRRAVIFPVKLLSGLFFCQSLAGSLFVVGWTYRLAQRTALKSWFSLSPRFKKGSTFADFAGANPGTETHVHWPNWIVQQNLGQAAGSRQEQGALWFAASAIGGLVNSVWMNLWIGLRALVNTWALTLPAGVFWWFGWYDGWNNSFNKGYEQAAAGPLISILGIVWFIVVMFYVPLAQARQAVTGEWRSFYQFRLIWQLVRARWVFCVLLALLYSALSVPLGILKTSPMFWMHNSAALSAMTGAQVLAALKVYFFWCGLLVLPSFVVVHLVAARVYASGLLSLVQSGKVPFSQLAQNERETLERLGLLMVAPEPERHAVVRAVTWTSTRLGRVVGACLLVSIWFSFVAQIYITQFLNYHSGLGWLNQPLVQLPWFRYLPTTVRNPMADVATVVLIVLTALLFRSIGRALRLGKSNAGVRVP